MHSSIINEVEDCHAMIQPSRWTDLLENPKALDMFRPEPSLECVVLTKLLIDRDGPYGYGVDPGPRIP